MPRTDGRPKIDGVCKKCGGEYYAKYLCRKCYQNSRRKTTRKLIAEDAVCIEEGCDRKPRAKDRCGSHYNVFMGYATPAQTGGTDGRGRKKKEIVGYRAAHKRVEEVKGKASSHDCPCGVPAQEWALDPLAIHTYEDGDGRVWSLNTDDYKAMCCKHHRLMDKQPDDWYIDLWLDSKGVN